MVDKDNFVMCRDGKEREVFPALIKDKNKIRHYITKFRTDMAILNILSPDLEKLGNLQSVSEVNTDVEKVEDDFSDEPYNAMMEMLVMAFGNKFTQEEIEGFVDVAMIPDILDIFFGISGYKKKAAKQTKKRK